MKLAIILAILLIFIVGCSTMQDGRSTHTISGTHDLVLNEQDLQQLGVINDGIDCNTEEYETNEYSTLAQYTFCNFTINNLNDTEVVLQLQKFANYQAINGTYQYDSSHLYSVEGLISENTFGDQSRFRVNNENDYGGQLNEPGIYYYHLWICKDLYLIHVTSKGSEEAEEYIAKIGQQILSKFD